MISHPTLLHLTILCRKFQEKIAGKNNFLLTKTCLILCRRTPPKKYLNFRTWPPNYTLITFLDAHVPVTVEISIIVDLKYTFYLLEYHAKKCLSFIVIYLFIYLFFFFWGGKLFFPVITVISFSSYSLPLAAEQKQSAG